MAIALKSTAFENGAAIPKRYTGEGEDVSPPLSWGDAPAGTKQFALICDDPDAPGAQPWVHWVIYNIDATQQQLPEGIAPVGHPEEPGGARQGRNSWPSDNVGYRGPMPPPGHGLHHYHFRLYALDHTLALAAGATKEQLLRAIDGHILAQGELVGTYQR